VKFSRSIRLSMAGLAAIAALSGCGGSNPAAPTPQLDTTPPPAPQNLTIAADASGHAVLVWSDSSAPDVAGYQVYVYSATAGDFVALGDGTSVDNTYFLPVVPNSVAASYRVRAVDASGNWSAPSSTADVLIPGPGQPFETQ
jgi:hypothetical protein